MSLDLNLKNVSTGRQVVKVRERGGRLQYGPIHTVGEWSDLHGAYRLQDSRGRTAGILRLDGLVMAWGGKPSGWSYSANPKHLKAALDSKRRRKRRLEVEVSEQKTKLGLLRPLTSTHHGEDFDLDYIDPDDLARKLTLTQVQTLIEWMS